MFSFLRNFLLEQEIKKTDSGRQFTSWNQVKTICIVIPHEVKVLNDVKNFISESKKEVDLVVFCNDKLTVANDVYLSVNKKDFGITGIPKPEKLQKLKGKKYDVVINGDMNNTFVLKALALLVKTKCRVGKAGLEYSKLFDISISEANNDFGNFLKQVLKYLTMIKAD